MREKHYPLVWYSTILCKGNTKIVQYHTEEVLVITGMNIFFEHIWDLVVLDILVFYCFEIFW